MAYVPCHVPCGVDIKYNSTQIIHFISNKIDSQMTISRTR